MQILPYLGDPSDVSDAAELIRAFGEDAAHEAASRAVRSSRHGNLVHSCRWRQIERLVVLLSQSRAVGTVH